jgi:hypothetical protein
MTGEAGLMAFQVAIAPVVALPAYFAHGSVERLATSKVRRDVLWPLFCRVGGGGRSNLKASL